MGVSYDADVVLWAEEQVALLRSGQFARLDIEHLADEIEDVGKSEKRELASRMAVLLAHLLKWRYQPERRGASWQATIAVQRRRVAVALRATPSLKTMLRDPDWAEEMWLAGVTKASDETGLGVETFPDVMPWTFDQVLDADFWPSGDK